MQSLALEFETDKELYLAFMPFIKQGGLFVRTHDSYQINSEISLEVTLPDSLEASQVIGRVCWQTPVAAQSGAPAGIGICFIEDPDNVRNQIEKTLGASLNANDPTLTM
jgi:type IV pilus assembly protein PilZ